MSFWSLLILCCWSCRRMRMHLTESRYRVALQDIIRICLIPNAMIHIACDQYIADKMESFWHWRTSYIDVFFWGRHQDIKPRFHQSRMVGNADGDEEDEVHYCSATLPTRLVPILSFFFVFHSSKGANLLIWRTDQVSNLFNHPGDMRVLYLQTKDFYWVNHWTNLKECYPEHRLWHFFNAGWWRWRYHQFLESAEV